MIRKIQNVREYPVLYLPAELKDLGFEPGKDVDIIIDRKNKQFAVYIPAEY